MPVVCHGGGLDVGAGDTAKVLAKEYRVRPRTEKQEKKRKVPRTVVTAEVYRYCLLSEPLGPLPLVFLPPAQWAYGQCLIGRSES